MKKALCLLLAAVLALSLAACRESSAQDSQAGGEKNAASAAAEPTEKPAEKSDPAEQEEEMCIRDSIQSVDEARHTYTMHYAKTFSEDVSSKDILIDSSLYGNVEEAAAVLVDMVKKKFNLA